MTDDVTYLDLPTARAIWNDRRARGTDLLVLLAVGTFVPAAGGSCWPSIQTLADRAGVKAKTVRDALGRLESAGLVEVQRRDRKPSVLTVTTPQMATTQMGSTPQMATTQMGSTPQMATTQMVVNYSPNGPQTTPQMGSRIKEVKKNICDVGFSDFFEAFPKKWDKEKAAENFRLAIEGGAVAEDIIVGARGYADAVQDIDSRYIKNPAGWLKDRRWISYLPSETDDPDNVTQQREKREKAEWCAAHYVSLAEYRRRENEPGFLAELDQRVTDHVRIWGEERRAMRTRQAVA